MKATVELFRGCVQKVYIDGKEIDFEVIEDY